MRLFTRKSAFVLVVVMVLASATTSFAQGVKFDAASLPRQARGEGITETMGEVVLQVANAPGTIRAGSSVSILFGGTITNPAAEPPRVSCVIGGVAQNPCAIGGPLTVAFSGNTLTLSFAADAPLVVGDTIVISQARLDVSGLADAADVNASMSGTSSQPTTNPITFFPSTVVVGKVVSPSFTVVAPSTLLGGTFGPPPLTILACAVPKGLPPVFPLPGVPDPNQFAITLTERFPAAFTTTAQEAAFTANVTVNQGSRVRIRLRGVPNGIRVFPGAPVLLSGAPAILAFSTPGASTSSGSDIDFDYTVNASNTAVIETIMLPFSVGLPPDGSTAGSLATLGATANVTGIARYRDTSGIVRFDPRTVASGTVFSVADCVTNLLFPYIASNVGGFDSGIVIANTSKDDGPFGGFGALETKGPCQLYGYKAADGAATTVFTTPTVEPGASYISLVSGISQLGGATGGFQGHIIAVCRFLNGHGFAFLFDGLGLPAPRVAEGYVANILPNPRPPIATGALETLGH